MPSSKLTSEQHRAREAFEKLLENKEEADRIYDSFPDSRGGGIISTDLARYLDERYRNTPRGQPKDLLPGWECAWRYAHDRLERELQNRGSRSIVRFMAGGWAAGKTHALETQSPPDLAWDGALSDVPWASKMIDLALGQQWHVDIAYVFRDIEMALYGAVERAKREGRGVPLGKLPATHRAVQSSILHLIETYHGNTRVSFALVHNFGTRGIIGTSKQISYADLAPHGPLNYTESYERYYGQAALEIGSLNPAKGERRKLKLWKMATLGSTGA